MLERRESRKALRKADQAARPKPRAAGASFMATVASPLPTIRRQSTFTPPPTYSCPWSTSYPMFSSSESSRRTPRTVPSARSPSTNHSVSPGTQRHGALAAARLRPLMLGTASPTTPRKPLEKPHEAVDMNKLTMPSMFGTQFNSKRQSPPGTVFGIGGRRRGDAPSTRAARPALSSLGAVSPGPKYKLWDALGVQPLSINNSASSAFLGATEDRWSLVERTMRARSTPGPGTYSPT